MDQPGVGGFLCSRIPPYVQCPQRQTRYRSHSAGAGANPIYRPGQSRPARMRFRLTPQASALPSPARPRAHPAGPCTRPACVRTSPPLGTVGRALPGHWSAATCPARPSLRSPPAGRSLSEAPPPWCGSQSLGFRTSRQSVRVPSRPELPDPEDIRPWLGPGVRPSGGGLGKHR